MGALALPAARYEAPALVWRGETASTEPWLVWAVFVYTFTAALVWATYCISQGGDPDIDVGWFRIKISCYK